MAGECEKELADERESRAALIDVLQETTDRELRQKARADAAEADRRQLAEALGLLTTLHPMMVIDPNDPLHMARQIEQHVRAEVERLTRKCSDLAILMNESAADAAESRRLLARALLNMRHRQPECAFAPCTCGVEALVGAIRAHLAGGER